MLENDSITPKVIDTILNYLITTEKSLGRDSTSDLIRGIFGLHMDKVSDSMVFKILEDANNKIRYF